MKIIFKRLIFFTICFSKLLSNLQSQSGKFINYQSIVRDASGKPISDQNLVITVYIYRDSLVKISDLLYQESFNNIAIKNGLVNLAIGKGEKALFGPGFDALNWNIEKPFYVKIDYPGLGIISPLRQLGVVPYALSANSEWKNNGDSALYLLNKFIGIGTDSPSDFININPKEEGGILIGNPNTGSGGFTSLRLGISKDTGGVSFIQSIKKSGSAWGDIILNPKGGKIGVGIQNPQTTLDINGPLRLNDGVFTALFFQNNSKQMYFELGGSDFYLFDPNHKRYGFIVKDNGNFGIGTSNPTATLDVNGSTKTKILEITGGSDITEKVHNFEGVQAGEVVSIDLFHPGVVKRSRKPYDKTVVGVVSGAGGISHGMQLVQEGVLDGNTLLAIAGRVYVKVTGKVEVGDLLTTSDAEGCAMAVKNNKKSQGAVIGKALTIPNAEGLVLMLVMMR